MAVEADIKLEKIAVILDAINQFNDSLEDKSVLLSRLLILSKRLLVKQERVQALLALSTFPDSELHSIVDGLLQLSTACTPSQRKQIFRIAVKHDLVLSPNICIDKM